MALDDASVPDGCAACTCPSATRRTSAKWLAFISPACQLYGILAAPSTRNILLESMRHFFKASTTLAWQMISPIYQLLPISGRGTFSGPYAGLERAPLLFHGRCPDPPWRGKARIYSVILRRTRNLMVWCVMGGRFEGRDRVTSRWLAWKVDKR